MKNQSVPEPIGQSNFATVLTILAFALTLIAATLVLIGGGPAILLAVICAVSFAAWRVTFDAAENPNSGILALYMLVPPVLLALHSARYAGGWPDMLGHHHAGWFNATFAFTGANWFVLLVCAPVTCILFGGCLISTYKPAGQFAAWWVALYAVVEGVIQLALGHSHSNSTVAILAALLGLALMSLGLLMVQKLLAGKARTVPNPPPMTIRERLLWAAAFVIATAVYGVILFGQAGPLPVAIIVGSMMGGLIGWWKTTSRVPADPSWSVPLMLLLLTLFYIHVGEEALTDFNGMISEISGVPWPDFEFMLLIGLVGPIVWFFAAWSLWHKHPIGNFIFWFLIVGMILGEPTHLLVFPVLRMQMLGIGYEYASGMYTALFPMIPAILALAKIVGDHRGRKATG